jgi:hypothetical protein
MSLVGSADSVLMLFSYADGELPARPGRRWAIFDSRTNDDTKRSRRGIREALVEGLGEGQCAVLLHPPSLTYMLLVS